MWLQMELMTHLVVWLSLLVVLELGLALEVLWTMILMSMLLPKVLLKLQQ
jgi:hypothetical protein